MHDAIPRRRAKKQPTPSWTDPLPPWSNDAEAWRRFRHSLDARIAHLRATDGIDGRRTPWQTFATPLPPLAERKPLPIGLIAPAPSNTHHRDEHGRYRKAS